MGNQKQIKHTGKIVGHVIRKHDRREKSFGVSTHVINEHILPHIQVRLENKALRMIPCPRMIGSVSVIDGQAPSLEQEITALKAVHDLYPIGSEVHVTERAGSGK